jgi:hypothetical protein
MYNPLTLIIIKTSHQCCNSNMSSSTKSSNVFSLPQNQDKPGSNKAIKHRETDDPVVKEHSKIPRAKASYDFDDSDSDDDDDDYETDDRQNEETMTGEAETAIEGELTAWYEDLELPPSTEGIADGLLFPKVG